MEKVNVAEIKARLSKYLDMAARGERVVICKHNRPVAELRAIDVVRGEPRPLGGASGQFAVPASFFDPLPEDVVSRFLGTEGQAPARGVERTSAGPGANRRTRQ
jgi:antitoxin (DNA-binding transcriptional repressor) of toxin-antitoxin stability system